MDQIILKQGKKEGHTSVVLAGVHGNEKCGVNALDLILPDLEIECGKVYFIYGNPEAIKLNKRFTEYNLNRAFGDPTNYSEEIRESYEYKRSLVIKKYLDEASALLDIHSAARPTEPFIFCESVSFETACMLPEDFKRIVSGSDDVEPGATDGYMSQRNKIGLCIECGQHDAVHVTDLATRSIFSFLKARKHISGETKIQKNRVHAKLTYAYYTKTDSFILTKDFDDFTEVTKGEIIGKDGDLNVCAPFTGLIVFARNCEKKNTEGFLMGKDGTEHF